MTRTSFQNNKAYFEAAEAWRRSPMIPKGLVDRLWTETGRPICPSCREVASEIGEHSYFDFREKWQFLGIPDLYFCICHRCDAALDSVEKSDAFITNLLLLVLAASGHEWARRREH